MVGTYLNNFVSHTGNVSNNAMLQHRVRLGKDVIKVLLEVNAKKYFHTNDLRA